MGLVAPLNTDSIPVKSESGDTRITTNDISTAVKDTFINRTAIAPATYPDIFKSLLQYGSGIPTYVEYFKKRGAFINNQTIDTSYSGERSAVHFSFDLIHNFEIRIEEQLETAIDPETTEMTINGSATVYPGFKPNLGDMFYLKLPDDNIGVFTVNNTLPLTITRGTHYKIEFHLDGLLDQDADAKLRASVTEELFFDKQYYFSDEAVLLTSTSYNQLSELQRHRLAIISRLLNKFYNTHEKTIICPGNVYDTFLIEYLHNKISLNDNRRDLCQIPNPFGHQFDGTIWQVILKQDISLLSFIGYTLIYYQQFLFDVNTSNIDMFRLITFPEPNKLFDAQRYKQAKFELTDPSFRTVNYIFSDRFYYALLHSFESAEIIPDIILYLGDINNDTRIYTNLNQQVYSVSDSSYHSMSFFDLHSKVTGSNNDMHLPEIEFMIFDFIINNKIDIDYLIIKVLAKFPFKNMTELDQIYTQALLLHLIDHSITRIR